MERVRKIMKNFGQDSQTESGTEHSPNKSLEQYFNTKLLGFELLK
jgi:hypothetical protein